MALPMGGTILDTPEAEEAYPEHRRAGSLEEEFNVDLEAEPEAEPEKTGTYTKMKNGKWGVRSTSLLEAGDLVDVVTRAGVHKTEKIGAVVWHGDGAWIATISSAKGSCDCTCSDCSYCRCDEMCVCRGGNCYDC